MIQARCPICSKSFSTPTLADWPTFPFCSERCRLVDLGRWIDGQYVVPGPEVPPSPTPQANGSIEVDEE